MKQKPSRYFGCALILFWLLPPAGIFSQTATGALAGTVTDKYGILITRAKIVATLRNSRQGAARNAFETYTNDQGKFNLKNLPPGAYEVRVSVEGAGGEIQRIVSVPKGRSVVVAIEIALGCFGVPQGSYVVAENDTAEVVRLTLIEALTSKLGLVAQEQKEKGLILSTRNIKPLWVKDVEGMRITLMGQRQIQRKADREGDFLYMSFPEIRIRRACIAVTVANTWAVARHSRKVYLSGGGYTYEYRKQAGKWTGKFVAGWIS
jgi:hypothetical protein